MFNKIKPIVAALLLCLPILCPAQADRNSPNRAEQVMKALAEAYPGRIERVQYRNNDWAVLLRGQWFYWAEGRILPENIRHRASEYDALQFYNYIRELPPWQAPTPEAAERFRNMSANRRQNPPKRSHYFFDTLWRAGSRDESYERVKQIRFLGHPILVHYAILEPLSLVEEQILTEAKTNPTVRAWINSISSHAGWNWRNVAETNSRSFHSYGMAVDITLKSSQGKESYWLWTLRTKPEWWNIPYDQRLHPPDPVIKAFESRGFVWGGKWLFFDTMHFEYRPEVFILSNIPMNTLR